MVDTKRRSGRVSDEIFGAPDPTDLPKKHVVKVSEDVKAIFDRHWGAAAYRNTTADEAVTRIRVLRDEWDD